MSATISENGVLQSSPSFPSKNIKIPYIIASIFMVALTAMFLVWAIHYQGGFQFSPFEPIKQMNWHALLSFIGFSLFFTESILIYRLHKTWSKNVTKIVHIAIHFAGFVLTTVGLAAVFSMDVSRHFTTFHSWIGLGTYLLFIIQFASGFVTRLVPVLPQFISSYHKECGIMIYGLAIITIATGLLLRIFMMLMISTDNGDLLANFIGLLFIIFSGLVLFMVIHPQYKRH